MVTSLGRTIQGVTITLGVVALFCVALRFHIRSSTRAGWKLDDYTILLALVTALTACACAFAGVAGFGFGDAPEDISPDERLGGVRLVYVILILNYFTYGVVKLSVLFFYKRIFTTKRFNTVANAFLLLVGAWTITAVFAHIFCAWPLDGFLWTGPDRLYDFATFSIIMAGLDLVLDLVIVLLPIPPVLKLHADTRKKISIIGLFSLGGFCVISSAVRIYYNTEYSRIGPTTPPDHAQFIANCITLWLTIESCASIIAACMPTLGGFLRNRAELKSRAADYHNNNNSPGSGGRGGSGKNSALKYPYHHSSDNSIGGGGGRAGGRSADLERNTPKPPQGNKGVWIPLKSGTGSDVEDAQEGVYCSQPGGRI